MLGWAALDGASGNTVSKVKSGRNSSRIANAAAAAGAQMLVTGLVVASGPSYTVNGRSYYDVPIVNPLGLGAERQKTSGTFSETARYLFIYNVSTNDVTVIDTGLNKIVAKLAGGEDDFGTVNDGKFPYTVSAGYVRFFETDNEFEKKTTYEGFDAEVLEIPGKNKAYLSQGLGRAVAVIDLVNLGEPVKIPGTSGKVIRLMSYE